MKFQASLALVVAAMAAAGNLLAQSPVISPTPAVGASVIANSPEASAAASPKAVEPKKPRGANKRVLEKYDANKNGVLDPEERAQFEADAPTRKAERLKKYDKNGDGKLDDEEKVQMRVDRLREDDAAKKSLKDASSSPAKP